MSGTRRLSATVMQAKGRGDWKLRAMPRRVRRWAPSPARSRPSNRTRPVSLTSVPHRQLTSVLLPEPLGPIKPTRSPAVTARSMPSSATKPPNRLESPSTSMSCAAMPLSIRNEAPPQPDQAIGRGDHEAHQQQADNQQIDGGGNRHRGDLLQRAEEDGADQRPDPARGAAPNRHRDGIDGVFEREGGRWLQVADIVRERRTGHAHQGARQGGGDQFQLQRGYARRFRGKLVVANGGKAVAEPGTLDRAR